MYSQDLGYLLTKNHNSMMRKSRYRNFTVDPFSCCNLTNRSDLGFLRKNALSLSASTEPEKVKVIKKCRRKRVNKKDNGLRNWNLCQSEVDSKKLIGNKCRLLTRRGVRLHQACLRKQKNSSE